MPAPTNYHCCEMCGRTNKVLAELMDQAELDGRFRAIGPNKRQITTEEEMELRERFQIKAVLLDDNMETEMCGFCIRTVGKAMKVEVMD